MKDFIKKNRSLIAIALGGSMMILGSFLWHFAVYAPATVFMALGFMAIAVGPMAVDLDQ